MGGTGAGSIATTYYYAEDFLGSSRTMVQAGQTSACFDADFLPFGREKDAVATCTQNDYKFEGKERDAETGNDDFGARYYSSNFGRWLSPDWSSTPEAVPYANLTNPQTLNLYAMVQDNPESFADLDGHVNSPQTASQTVTCNVTDTFDCNYYQAGWIFTITNSPSDPASHDITALANKINLWSLPGWPYALTFTPRGISVAQCLKDIAKCQQTAKDPQQSSAIVMVFPAVAGAAPKLLPYLIEVSAIARAATIWAEAFRFLVLAPSAGTFKGDESPIIRKQEEEAAQEKERNPAQDKKLTAGEIGKLQDADVDVHELKGRGNASQRDLFKDKAGNIYVKPKSGAGPGEPTGLNINDY